MYILLLILHLLWEVRGKSPKGPLLWNVVYLDHFTLYYYHYDDRLHIQGYWMWCYNVCKHLLAVSLLLLRFNINYTPWDVRLGQCNVGFIKIWIFEKHYTRLGSSINHLRKNPVSCSPPRTMLFGVLFTLKIATKSPTISIIDP